MLETMDGGGTRAEDERGKARKESSQARELARGAMEKQTNKGVS